MKRAPFISFEGVEGAGKSTLINGLELKLQELGIACHVTHEPGGCELGSDIREILLHKIDLKLEPVSELLLFYANRWQHLHEVILPKIQSGIWVLCDRFHDASYAYQGAGREIDTFRLDYLTDWVVGENKPDITFLLDLPVEQGLKRVRDRQGRADRIEQESIAFFTQVQSAYLQRAAFEPERFHRLDAEENMEGVLMKAWEQLKPYLGGLR